MNTNMNLQRISVDRLKPAKYNPRKDLKPGDPAYEKIKRSLHEFGYVDPVIWNEVTGNIVGGHQRYKVLTAEGATEIDCVVVHIENPQEEKALNIALNKAVGEWEPVALADLLNDLNQCNQPLQCNNTSGVSGVSFYAPRGKYRARIKIGQHDIHPGYYSSFAEAVQARNVGMECMFGEYGRYNDAAPEPAWIRTKATEQCRRFAELSLCKAFRLCGKSQTGGGSHGDGRKKAEAHGAEGAGRRPGQGAAAVQRA